MSKSSVIAVDLDDIIGDFCDAFDIYMNRKLGLNITKEDHVSFDLAKIYGINKEQERHHTHQFTHHHHGSILPTPYSYQGLRHLAENRILDGVTARSDQIKHITLGWLELHDYLKFFRNWHFTNAVILNKPQVSRKKSEVCTIIGADALIEDAVHNAIDVALNCNIPVIMPAKPWNDPKVAIPGQELPSLVHRVPDDWRAITAKVDELVPI